MQVAVARRPAIARGAAVAGKTLARERLVHQPEHRFAEPHQADQSAPGQHAGDERLGAVDRIEHPDIFGVGMLGAVFLAENSVIGKLLADERAHALFRRAVGRRHRVEAADFLVLDRESGAKEGEDRIARRGGELIDEAAEVDGRHAAPAFCRLVAIGESVSRQPRARIESRPAAALLLRCGIST